MFGKFQSPNYPEGYPSDTDITWNITVPLGFRIKLYFMHFDLEPSYLCEYDYVKVGWQQSDQTQVADYIPLYNITKIKT